ncbi:MAG: nucleoside triphosphate pyrophosphohydrolase [Planctomycetes bacterium]|nr:nucleoside triphosphate pyrophosphohydrolase [Planctomycetota bacterium]
MSGEGAAYDRLVDVMRRLLGSGGCPWDREQTPDSIRPFLLEEAYEVLAGLDEKNPAVVKEELGDLLYQVVFLGALFEKTGAFTGADVVNGIADKLVRRHPWVFGDASVADSRDALANWEKLKTQERRGTKKDSVLDGVPADLPALLKAARLSSKAARVGFDWPDVGAVLEKLDEEVRELREALKGGDPSRLEDEMGDLFFTLANMARKMNVDPESALRRTNDKFMKRFRYVEKALRAQGKAPESATLEEMEALWIEAKTKA